MLKASRSSLIWLAHTYYQEIILIALSNAKSPTFSLYFQEHNERAQFIKRAWKAATINNFQRFYHNSNA